MLGTTRKGGITTDAIAAKLVSLGVQPVDFSDWHGFDPDEDFEKRDRVREEIEKRRRKIGTYTHVRQTTAEAEVAIVVDGIRSARLQPPTGNATDAFFLSSTRVVDQLHGLTRRICLFPVGLAQWVWSARPVSSGHSELVFQQLLWELAQGGVGFVDDATLLRRFSGVIEVAAADLQASVSDRREHLLERYGPDPADAFVHANRLDIPSVPSRHNLRPRTWVTARNHRRITAPHTRTFNHGAALGSPAKSGKKPWIVWKRSWSEKGNAYGRQRRAQN